MCASCRQIVSVKTATWHSAESMQQVLCILCCNCLQSKQSNGESFNCTWQSVNCQVEIPWCVGICRPAGHRGYISNRTGVQLALLTLESRHARANSVTVAYKITSFAQRPFSLVSLPVSISLTFYIYDDFCCLTHDSICFGFCCLVLDFTELFILRLLLELRNLIYFWKFLVLH